MNCSNCGSENKEGAKFCNKCGTKIEEVKVVSEIQQNTINFCSKCGSKIEGEHVFCVQCGSELAPVKDETTHVENVTKAIESKIESITKKSFPVKKVLLVAIPVLIIGVIGVSFFFFTGKSKDIEFVIANTVSEIKNEIKATVKSNKDITTAYSVLQKDFIWNYSDGYNDIEFVVDKTKTGYSAENEYGTVEVIQDEDSFDLIYTGEDVDDSYSVSLLEPFFEFNSKDIVKYSPELMEINSQYKIELLNFLKEHEVSVNKSSSSKYDYEFKYEFDASEVTALMGDYLEANIEYFEDQLDNLEIETEVTYIEENLVGEFQMIIEDFEDLQQEIEDYDYAEEYTLTIKTVNNKIKCIGMKVKYDGDTFKGEIEVSNPEDYLNSTYDFKTDDIEGSFKLEFNDKLWSMNYEDSYDVKASFVWDLEQGLLTIEDQASIYRSDRYIVNKSEFKISSDKKTGVNIELVEGGAILYDGDEIVDTNKLKHEITMTFTPN